MSTITHLRPGQASDERALSPQSVLARLDRIDAWSMPFLFLGIIGTGFLFAFYDVFDINVSFIQTCVALKHGCTPENAITTLRIPVVLNLAGYVIGALILAPISDRVGRRNMLMFTMGLTGLGALYSAVAPDYTHFVLVADRDGNRRRRRPGDRQHVRRRGRAPAQPLPLDLADLHHVLARSAARHLAGARAHDRARRLAQWDLVRAGQPHVHQRLALDVRDRRAACADRDRAAGEAARVSAVAGRARTRSRKPTRSSPRWSASPPSTAPWHPSTRTCRSTPRARARRRLQTCCRTAST